MAETKKKALNLEELMKGDYKPRVDWEREYAISERFANLFSVPVQKKILFWKYNSKEFPNLSRNAIKQILTNRGLLAEGANPDEAVDEALNAEFHTASNACYHFVRLTDGDGNKTYQMCHYSPIDD